MLPVPEHNASHVADAVAVHQHLAAGHCAGDADGILCQLNDLADFADDDVVGVHSHALRQPGVELHHPLLTVNGNKELGSHQCVHDAQLLLAGVSGHVQIQLPLVDHLCALAVQLVDHRADGALVARDGAGRHDDAVTGLNLNLPVGGEGNAPHGGHGLALAAGGDDTHLVPGQGADLVQVYHHALRDLHIPQLPGNLQGVLHAPSGDRHLAPVAGGHVDDLLDAVNVGREGGDDDALVTALEQGIEGVAHLLLALGVARVLHVGGVAQHGQHALVAQLPKPGQVNHAAGNGGGVDFPVAGVYHRAQGTLDGKGHRVGNGVVHVDKLHREAARPDHVPRLAGVNVRGGPQSVLLQLQLHQPGGHAGAVNGCGDIPQHVGQGTDVVLMAMGQENRPDLCLVANQIADIRNDHVNSVHIIVRESHSHIHNDDVIAVLVDRQVLADLVQSAQRNNFQFFCHINNDAPFAPFCHVCSVILPPQSTE